MSKLNKNNPNDESDAEILKAIKILEQSKMLENTEIRELLKENNYSIKEHTVQKQNGSFPIIKIIYFLIFIGLIPLLMGYLLLLKTDYWQLDTSARILMYSLAGLMVFSILFYLFKWKTFFSVLLPIGLILTAMSGEGWATLFGVISVHAIQKTPIHEKALVEVANQESCHRNKNAEGQKLELYLPKQDFRYSICVKTSEYFSQGDTIEVIVRKNRWATHIDRKNKK